MATRKKSEAGVTERMLGLELKAIEDPKLSLYELLDLRVADIEFFGDRAISDARARRARIFHPDRLAGLSEDLRKRAEQAMMRVNVAHDTLHDPKTRAHYDKYVVVRSHYACLACKGTGIKKLQRGFTKVDAVICPACQGRVFMNRGATK